MSLKLKTCCGILGVVSLLTSPSLFASIGTGSLFITAPGYALNGDQAGPYNVLISTVTGGLTPVSTGGSFETFCLGTQVNYTPSSTSTYGYEISDTVQPTAGVETPPDGKGYVTWGTAYLYSQYRAGVFSSAVLLGSQFGNGSVNNPATDALQYAIWTLQGQNLNSPETVSFGPGGPDSDDYTYFMNLVEGQNPSGYENDADGDFGVYALDLLNSPGNYAQPQLCLVPVPEPTTILAGALMLLPFGASAFRIARKRLA